MINFPNGKKAILNTNKQTKSSTAANRGMSLEEDLNASNQYYLAHDMANIHKKPTPVQIVKVDYPKRSAAKITEAYYKTPSTTDYNGVYKGYYIDFEAKETRNLNFFKLALVHPHQVKHLKSVINHGGLAFFIIKFSAYDEVYLISAKYVIDCIDQGFKHILYKDLKENGYRILGKYQPRLDYLACIDQYIKEVY